MWVHINFVWWILICIRNADPAPVAWNKKSIINYYNYIIIIINYDIRVITNKKSIINYDIRVITNFV